ncbi:hypothetical protein MRX96_040875 [Rhipicephalus microplus]
MNCLNKCARLCRLLLSDVTAKSSVIRSTTPRIAQSPCSASLHTSCVQRGLMEFFEPKDNWGADEVRSGKSWSKDELRIKSNSDLHKLWYILLKEKNMLLTMEEAAKREVELFPNPERIDKVKESMNNLEEVENIYGFVRDFALKEHLMPRTCNPKGYFRLWRDKDLNEVSPIIKRFPHVDRSLLREMYPDVDIDKLEKIMQEKIYIAYEQQTT